MPMLTVNAVNVPLVGEPVDADIERIGDDAVAWDGTALTRRRGYKRAYTCRTSWLESTTASNVLSALEGSPPRTVTGDLMGSVSAIITVTRHMRHTDGKGVRLTAYEFVVREV